MQSIDALKCVYDTKNRKWAVEILYAAGEQTHRFDIAGPQEAQTVIEAFNMAVVSVKSLTSSNTSLLSCTQQKSISLRCCPLKGR